MDTLQKVREVVNDSYSYSSDYEVIGKLKQFADRYGVCVLIVHHTRKQPAGDSFEMISGTTGLLGCADGALLMQKEKRTNSKATLEVVGRDQPDQRLYLSKDQEILVWVFDHAENELWKQPPDPVLEAVAKIVSADNREWEGSPTELAQAIQTDMAVNRLTKHLNVNASRLLEEHQVRYENKTKHAGRRIRLTYMMVEAPAFEVIEYSLQKKDLTEEDKNYLDASLVECYDRYGITFDNASVVDENGAFKEMPIIPDWYNVLLEKPETKHLAVVLTRYVTGSAAAMGRRNHISIDNKYIVLDTSGMPDDLILPGIYWAIDVANDIIMNAGGELSALIADELWSLVGAGSNPLAAAYVQEMVKTIRGLGGIAITSTQGMQDLFSLEGGKYGKGILDSSRIKFVMQMEEQEARLIQQILNLSEEEVRQITRFRRGEGLLCIGYNHVPVAFHVTKKEYDAITTSPTDRQARKKGAK